MAVDLKSRAAADILLYYRADIAVKVIYFTAISAFHVQMTVAFAVAYILIYEAATVAPDGAVDYPVLNELRHQAVSGAFADIVGADRLGYLLYAERLILILAQKVDEFRPLVSVIGFQFNHLKIENYYQIAILLYPLILKSQAEFENYYRILNFAVSP